MTSHRYGVGLIGAGWVASEYLNAFRNHPLTQIVGIYNRTPGKAAHLLASHGIDGQEYGTLDQLFDDVAHRDLHGPLGLHRPGGTHQEHFHVLHARLHVRLHLMGQVMGGPLHGLLPRRAPAVR